MDANEFEFPPDQLDDDVPSSLAPFPASAQEIPLSALAQMPLEQLPPTQPSNPQNFSIAQVMRGALSTTQLRSTSAGGGRGAGGSSAAGFRRPPPTVAALPVPAHPLPASAAPGRSLYSSATHPALPVEAEEEERAGGAEARAASVAEDVAPVPTFAGKPSRLDWTEGEVRSFYQALSQFGTDFSAIAVLFPRRSRSDIKRLYQREMRQKPKEVQQAINQKAPIDMPLFKERFEAKRQEEQQPVTTKTLNVEELALVNEIERGLLSGLALSLEGESGEATTPPAASTHQLGASSGTTPPSSAKSRKRKREPAAVTATEKAEHQQQGKVHAAKAEHDDGADSENESLFDMAMRHDREDNTPLDTLFFEHTAPVADEEFSFE